MVGVGVADADRRRPARPVRPRRPIGSGGPIRSSPEVEPFHERAGPVRHLRRADERQRRVGDDRADVVGGAAAQPALRPRPRAEVGNDDHRVLRVGDLQERLPFKDGGRGIGWMGGLVTGQVDNRGRFAFAEAGGRVGYLMPDGEIVTVAGWRVRPDRDPVWITKSMTQIRGNEELRGVWLEGAYPGETGGFRTPMDIAIDPRNEYVWYVRLLRGSLHLASRRRSRHADRDGHGLRRRSRPRPRIRRRPGPGGALQRPDVDRLRSGRRRDVRRRSGSAPDPPHHPRRRRHARCSAARTWCPRWRRAA